MATTTIAKLAAGTIVSASFDDGVTYERIRGLTGVGAIGEMAETQETTTLEDTARTYIAALSTPADKAFVGNLYPSEAGQKKFITAAKNQETIWIKIVLPGSPKSIGLNKVALLGFQIDEPTAEGVITFTVNGKASGKTAWGIDPTIDATNVIVTGSADALRVSGTKQLTAEIYPDDASVKDIVWSSVNPLTATVSSTGLVSGVAVGEYTIFAKSVTNEDVFGIFTGVVLAEID
ncbi:hypothetical protein [Dickeya phage Sucellus]|nr:hypothetical protein [Dickeya phage Sucellus]